MKWLNKIAWALFGLTLLSLGYVVFSNDWAAGFITLTLFIGLLICIGVILVRNSAKEVTAKSFITFTPQAHLPLFIILFLLTGISNSFLAPNDKPYVFGGMTVAALLSLVRLPRLVKTVLVIGVITLTLVFIV